MNEITEENEFVKLGIEIGNLVSKKNKAYGNSLFSVGDILKLFYPNGIQVDHYYMVSVMSRIMDKLKRLSENPDDCDAWGDLMGYGMLGLNKARRTKERKENNE